MLTNNLVGSINEETKIKSNDHIQKERKYKIEEVHEIQSIWKVKDSRIAKHLNIQKSF